MHRSIRKLALGLIVALVGCSSQEEARQEGQTLFTTDSIEPLVHVQETGKDSDVDTQGLDIELLVRPDRASSDNTTYMKLKAYEGALEDEVLLTGDWMGDNPDEPYFGYDFGPEGTEFLVPLEAKFQLRMRQLVGIPPECLYVLLDLENGWYQVIPHDLERQGDKLKLRFEIDHFSKYLLGVGPPPDENNDN